jgi:hypothetical protein
VGNDKPHNIIRHSIRISRHGGDITNRLLAAIAIPDSDAAAGDRYCDNCAAITNADTGGAQRFPDNTCKIRR